MTLEQIFADFTKGSQGFVKAVEMHCGFNASATEIARIADKSTDAQSFQAIWEGQDDWTDEANETE